MPQGNKYLHPKAAKEVDQVACPLMLPFFSGSVIAIGGGISLDYQMSLCSTLVLAQQTLTGLEDLDSC